MKFWNKIGYYIDEYTDILLALFIIVPITMVLVGVFVGGDRELRREDARDAYIRDKRDVKLRRADARDANIRDIRESLMRTNEQLSRIIELLEKKD